MTTKILSLCLSQQKKQKKDNLHRAHPWLCKTNIMMMKRSSSSPLPLEEKKLEKRMTSSIVLTSTPSKPR
jgi:hypothetical protein